jgi:hypothetical protein
MYRQSGCQLADLKEGGVVWCRYTHGDAGSYHLNGNILQLISV